MRLVKGIFILLLLSQAAVGIFFINQWFFRSILPMAFTLYRIPIEERLLTMSETEALFIVKINSSFAADAHILWLPPSDPIVNYYIFPRRMYHIKDYRADEIAEVEKEFLRQRGIQYVVRKFEPLSVTLIPVKYDHEGDYISY